MDVEPETFREHVVRDDKAVVRNDHRRRPELEARREALGIENRDFQPPGDLLRR